MNGVIREQGWGESVRVAYVWGRAVWTSYETMKWYNDPAVSDDIDEFICGIAFRKYYFLEVDHDY